MATNFGIDSLWPNGDTPLISVPTNDPRIVVGQRIFNRLRTRRGGLAVIGGDPNGGWDVRRYMLARVSTATLGQAEAQVAAEAAKDEAVQSASAHFVYSAKTLTITLNLVLVNGVTLQMVLSVTALTVAAVYNY
jgi:hypothetical protein